jgi:hypothetical protein
MNALRRARFAASVRVIKDLRTEEDLRYLLERLPPWITTADWERGDSVQVLLSILWPAINSTVCAILRRELEERVQESSDFGHIAFSRLSFGKHPPVVVGIKAVPLHGEDLLAMVVDVDIRWAGEPDVALHLTKLGGASLGLSNVHLAGIVRLVFSPITEDPPFLRHMAVSLLNRPYVDFSVRALGGPDLMALPAISSWLQSVVLGLADKAIVWPKEVGIPLAPRPASEAKEEAAAEAAAMSKVPPMGILVVEILSADIEPRRSTFLGRIKAPSPRVSLVLPEASGPDGADEGVMQAGLTAVQGKTLSPEWNSQFHFVVSRPTQQLRLLVSHKRMDLLGADMPLGLADLPIEDILADYHAMQDEQKEAECVILDALQDAIAVGDKKEEQSATHNVGNAADENGMVTPPRKINDIRIGKNNNNNTQRQRTPSLSISPSLFLNGNNDSTHTNNASGSSPECYDDADDSGFDSASSSPVRSRSLSPSLSINSGRWASPATSFSVPAEIYHQRNGAIDSKGGGGGPPSMTVRTRSVQVHWPDSITQAMEASGAVNTSTFGPSKDELPPVGLGVALATTPGSSLHQQPHWGPAQTFTSCRAASGIHTTPPTSLKYLGASHKSSLRPSSSRKLPSIHTKVDGNGHSIECEGCDDATEEPPASWVSPDGIWISIPAARSVTMAGMVSNAVDTRNSNTGGDGLSRMASNINDQGQPGWLKSIQSMVFGINREYDNVVADHEDVDDVMAVRSKKRQDQQGGNNSSSGGEERSTAGHEDDGATSGINSAGLSKTAGRVRLVVQWLPVATADVVAAAAAAVAAAEAEAVELKREKRRKKKRSKHLSEDDSATDAAAAAAIENELDKKAKASGGYIGAGALGSLDDEQQEDNISTTPSSLPSLPSSEVVKALSFKASSIASTPRPTSDTGPLTNLEISGNRNYSAGNGSSNGVPPTAINPVLSPGPAPRSVLSQPGILAIRVTFTKLDYGDSPGNPILALSIGSNAVAPMSSVAAAAAAAAVSPPERMICMDCQAGSRPGLLHWGRVFHLPVWDPLASRAILELGDAKSTWKLSTYGGQLYALDACANFDGDVSVEAAALIPLKDVVTKGVVRGSWRLREARGRRGATAAVGPGGEHEQLDVGRVALVMAWFPLA